MKSLEDIILDIGEWVKVHGPIKRKFPTVVSLIEVPQIIEQSRARTMPKGLTPRNAVGWQIAAHEDVRIAFISWRTPEGKLTLYQPDMKAITAVFNLVSAGYSIGEAVDTFMKDLE